MCQQLLVKFYRNTWCLFGGLQAVICEQMDKWVMLMVHFLQFLLL
jgi:hypothetical protein